MLAGHRELDSRPVSRRFRLRRRPLVHIYARSKSARVGATRSASPGASVRRAARVSWFALNRAHVVSDDCDDPVGLGLAVCCFGALVLLDPLPHGAVHGRDGVTEYYRKPVAAREPTM